MRLLFLLFSFFWAASVLGQTTVRGTIVDATDNETIPGATVLLIKLPDSTQAGAATNTQGRFIISGVAPGSYLLQVSFIGYTTLQRPLRVADQPIELGRIAISEGATVLTEVQITATIPPASQNEDTTQFNAAAFKVTRDASAEDLVQKMPGVTLEGGQIKTQGEAVRRVLVDGKPFFGDDPAAALRNLPAEVIDKIQVFDQQSEQSRFTGFNDGNTTKTINIITKADKKNGRFGRIHAGVGNDERYQAGFALNQFQGSQRFTVLGQINNINQQNFSSEDLSGINSQGGGGFGGRGMGGFGRGGGGGADFQVPQINGITTTRALGFNYSDKWGKKVEISSSYFFNQTQNDAFQNRLRQYVQQGDSGRVYQESQQADSRNTNHRFNARLEWKVDSMNTILIMPRLTLQDTRGFSGLLGQTREGAGLLNQTINSFDTELLNYNGTTDLMWRHQFAKKGRTVSVGASGGLSGSDGESNLLADNRYFTGGAVSDSINQFSRLDRNGWNGSGNMFYTEPVSEKGQVHANYNASYQSTDSDRRTFDFSEVTSSYTDPNLLLSNSFTNRYLTQQVGGGYRYNAEKYDFMVRATYQHAQLRNQQQFPAETRIHRTFQDVLPFSMFRYRFSKTENVRVFYRTSTSPPSAEQLQNVLNNANPLVLTIGNPALRQNYQHNLSSHYTRTTEKSKSIVAVLGGTFTENFVGNQTFIASQDTVVLGNIFLPRGAQLTQPVNLDGQYRLRSFLTYGMPVKFSDKSINLNLNVGADYSRTPGLINQQQNFAQTQNYSAGLVISSNISENLDFTIGTTSNGVINHNTLRPQLNSRYLNQTSRASLKWIIYKGLFVQSDLTHQVYAGLAPGFGQNFALWNASAGKKLFADQSGEIRLSVFDILEQNRSIQRNITETYLEDVNTRVLQRYFMLHFSYQLRKFYGDSKAPASDTPEGAPDGQHPGRRRPE